MCLQVKARNDCEWNRTSKCIAEGGSSPKEVSRCKTSTYQLWRLKSKIAQEKVLCEEPGGSRVTKRWLGLGTSVVLVSKVNRLFAAHKGGIGWVHRGEKRWLLMVVLEVQEGGFRVRYSLAMFEDHKKFRYEKSDWCKLKCCFYFNL